MMMMMTFIDILLVNCVFDVKSACLLYSLQHETSEIKKQVYSCDVSIHDYTVSNCACSTGQISMLPPELSQKNGIHS